MIFPAIFEIEREIGTLRFFARLFSDAKIMPIFRDRAKSLLRKIFSARDKFLRLECDYKIANVRD